MSFLPILAALAAGLQSAVSPVFTDEVAREARERIVVTAVASRASEAVDATPATVSVITREDLERDLARDIRDALRYEPGVSVEHSAARFGLGNISIRGLEGNRVQMLVDGVRMPDGFRIGSFSNASRNPYDLGLLSRIEVLRGPGSALYGSDALAGVVSLTTMATSGPDQGGTVQAESATANKRPIHSARSDGNEALCLDVDDVLPTNIGGTPPVFCVPADFGRKPEAASLLTGWPV